jgi:anti-anti-sigma factor
MDVVFSQSRKVAVVAPRGDQDMSTSNQFRAAVHLACEAIELAVVDFAGVTFADSSILGVIAGGAKACAAQGRRLIVINASGIADRAMRLTGLGDLYADPSDVEHNELPALLARG